MIDKMRNHSMIAFVIAYLDARFDPRDKSDRGASAVEWAIIAAICVVAAIAIGVAVNALVTQGTTSLNTDIPTI